MARPPAHQVPSGSRASALRTRANPGVCSVIHRRSALGCNACFAFHQGTSFYAACRQPQRPQHAPHGAGGWLGGRGGGRFGGPAPVARRATPVEPPGAEPVRGRCRGHHLGGAAPGAPSAGCRVAGVGCVGGRVAGGGQQWRHQQPQPAYLSRSDRAVWLAAGQPLHHGFAGGHRRFVCIFPVG